MSLKYWECDICGSPVSTADPNALAASAHAGPVSMLEGVPVFIVLCGFHQSVSREFDRIEHEATARQRKNNEPT